MTFRRPPLRGRPFLGGNLLRSRLRVLPVLVLGLLAAPAVQGQPAFLVKDVNTTSVQHPQDINSFRRLAALGNVVFFAADDAGAYGLELWRTDGTFAGTSMVRDICPGSCASLPHELAVANGKVFVRNAKGDLLCLQL